MRTAFSFTCLALFCDSGRTGKSLCCAANKCFRVSDKRGYSENSKIMFSYLATKTCVVTCHQNHLKETYFVTHH